MELYWWCVYLQKAASELRKPHRVCRSLCAVCTGTHQHPLRHTHCGASKWKIPLIKLIKVEPTCFMATVCRFLNVNADHEKLVDGPTLMLHSLLSEIIEFLLPSLFPPPNSKHIQNGDPTVIQLRAFSLTAVVLFQSLELSSDAAS